MTQIKPECNKTFNFIDNSKKDENLKKIREYNEKSKNKNNESLYHCSILESCKEKIRSVFFITL